MMPGRPDWYEILRRLLHQLYLKPEYVWEEMTFPEIAMALDDDFEHMRPPPGAVVASHEEIVASARRRATMTRLERLEEAERG